MWRSSRRKIKCRKKKLRFSKVIAISAKILKCFLQATQHRQCHRKWLSKRTVMLKMLSYPKVLNQRSISSTSISFKDWNKAKRISLSSTLLSFFRKSSGIFLQKTNLCLRTKLNSTRRDFLMKKLGFKKSSILRNVKGIKNMMKKRWWVQDLQNLLLSKNHLSLINLRIYKNHQK